MSPQASGGRRFELSSATIKDTHAAVDANALGYEQLVELYLARIERYDKSLINSVLSINPNARATARLMDAERASTGKRRSLLHGIPILLKDLLDLRGMPTTAGFAPMSRSMPDKDSFVVRQLRDAGAVILGKCNLSDWFGKTAPGDHSTLGGRTANPYNLDLSPGRSSGGTAAAVAAYFATAGIGTETGISVRNPASNTNLFALVPTRGLVSRSGQLMASFTLDRAAPLARNVFDLAALLTTMVGFDAQDLSTAASLGNVPRRPYTEYIDHNGLRAAQLGVLRDMFRSGHRHAEGLLLIETALQRIVEAGADLKDPLTTGTDLLNQLARARPLEEARSCFELYLSALSIEAPIRSVATLLSREGSKLKPNLLELFEIGSLSEHSEYLQKIQSALELRQRMIAFMDAHQVDALLYPFKTEPAQVDDSAATESDNALSSITGLPAMVVPVGFITSNNAPIAMEILGRPWSEPLLIKLASGFERAFPQRRTPPSTPPLPAEAFEY
jgi:amidase